MSSLSAYNIIIIYSKAEDYETENKTCVDTRIRVRENGGSLDFNSLLNSAVDENWVCRHCLLQFILGKCFHVRCSKLWNLGKLFVNGKFTKRFHFFCARIYFFLFICSLYSQWATIRLLHHQFGLCMCVNFRLCSTHFSCHWRKIRNVLSRLTQISKRQRDPRSSFTHLFVHNFFTSFCLNFQFKLNATLSLYILYCIKLQLIISTTALALRRCKPGKWLQARKVNLSQQKTNMQYAWNLKYWYPYKINNKMNDCGDCSNPEIERRKRTG